MRTALLLRRTRMHFPRLNLDEIEISPIEKGGSDRKFYRIHSAADQRLILVKYNLEREENRHYVQIAKFLDSHGIRVPKIYFHDPAEGLMWIEDLGERDLCSYQHEGWLVRRAFYESALDEIIKLHSLPESVCVEMKEHLPAEFNATLYVWEQNYFFENCLGRYFGVDNVKLGSLASLPALNQIAEDLASLLYDPYVDLTEAERAELIAYYREQQIKNGITVNGEFDSKLRHCAMQRLMQALGAYGFLGLVKGHKHFLKHLPAAMKSLRSIVAGLTGLDELERTLEELLAR